jgi:hypothetical protein
LGFIKAQGKRGHPNNPVRAQAFALKAVRINLTRYEKSWARDYIEAEAVACDPETGLLEKLATKRFWAEGKRHLAAGRSADVGHQNREVRINDLISR